MKCKPNDVAQIVRNTTDQVCRAGLIGGAFVKVETLFDHPWDGPSWTYSSEPLRCPFWGHICPTLRSVPDADLEPLPGAENMKPAEEPTWVVGPQYEVSHA